MWVFKNNYLAHKISTTRMAVVRHQRIAKSGLFLDLQTGTFQCFLYCRLLAYYLAVKERDLLLKMHFHLGDCDPAWWDREKWRHSYFNDHGFGKLYDIITNTYCRAGLHLSGMKTKRLYKARVGKNTDPGIDRAKPCLPQYWCASFTCRAIVRNPYSNS